MQHRTGDHALLADGRTAALVDPEGNIAWLCWPRIDSMPCLLAILDASRGGGFSLRPRHPEARVLSRHYLPGSLVLRTRWQLGASRLVVEEALSWAGPPRLLRWARSEAGSMEMIVRFAPAFDAARAAARLELQGEVVLAHGSGLSLAVAAPRPWHSAGDGCAECLVSVAPTEPAGFALSAPLDVASSAVRQLLDATLEEWAAMAPSQDALQPSALAERTLGAALGGELLVLSACVLTGLRSRDGGIVAAPTTSLPQWPASSRTWDYRYSWLRDSSLAAIALARLGRMDQAGGLAEFIGSVAREEGPRALVRVDGSTAPEEMELAHLAGHGGAQPVRIGNAAAVQPQLDVCGEVIEVASALAAADALPTSLQMAVPRLADWIVASWRRPDHGIWEIRGARRHYTHSRLLAWFGLREAAGLAARGLVSGDPTPWERCAEDVRHALLRSARPYAALQLHDGGGGADAALALVPLLGLLPPSDARVRATLELITARLSRAGLMDRYEGQPDELGEPCGPFLFPTHWTAMALDACGGDGSSLFASAAGARGSTGLFAEVADPHDGSPLGNYPQVQSHAAFVLAATATGALTRWQGSKVLT